ncbi:hypothetical protein PanWU01x14_321230 [Parasponia andersonii]|uniref:Uncharacterized protein n=1 Tax=Parasponia andersonii TaxID=3476 RepID=A0A2P5ALB6_PARAD|nr:hypothetical protein PanWU01x14_321230 [Parasponia andersonii]
MVKLGGVTSCLLNDPNSESAMGQSFYLRSRVIMLDTVKEDKRFGKKGDAETLRFEKAEILGDFGKVRNERKCSFYRGGAEEFFPGGGQGKEDGSVRISKFEKIMTRDGVPPRRQLGSHVYPSNWRNGETISPLDGYEFIK